MAGGGYYEKNSVYVFLPVAHLGEKEIHVKKGAFNALFTR